MLRALRKKTEENVILADDRWLDEVDFLREEARQDKLICHVCRQPVTVKAGEIRIWHFAHKVAGSCSLANEDGLLVVARSALFRWLSKKYPEHVTIEQSLPGSGLPRPVDCCVEMPDGRRFAYWILAKSMNEATALDLQEKLTGTGVLPTWVLLKPILVETDVPGEVRLSTTERVLLKKTQYDCIYRAGHGAGGQTLNYLDPDSKKLICYRSLCIRHYPQAYKGHRLEELLSAVLIDPADGSFVFEGENEQAQRVRAEDKLRREEAQARRLDAGFHLLPPPPSYSPLNDRKAPCERCGKVVSNWISYNGTKGTCVCRDCMYPSQEPEEADF